MRGRRSPRLVTWIVRAFLPAEEVDPVLGDLLELQSAQGRGSWWLVVQAVTFAAVYGAERWTGGTSTASTGNDKGKHFRGEGMTMEGWMRDVRVAVRSLLRRPGFTLVVVGTLGLGIGATTAIYGVLRGSLFTDLPYDAPDELIWLSEGYEDWGRYGSSMAVGNILDLRERATLLHSMEAYSVQSSNLAEGDRVERARGLRVGPAFLQTLGVTPALGRDFTAAENVAGAARVVILSDGLWRERFGGNRTILGSTITLDAEPAAVVGVLPPSFEFRADPRFLTLIGYGGADRSQSGRSLNAIARMKDGVSVEAAREELRAIFAGLVQERPEVNTKWQVWADPLKDHLVGGVADSLKLLGAAVIFVLLVACTNVANLLLVRAESRQRELAVRVALGAGRGGLLTVFLAESLCLGLAGGAVGVGIAYLGVPALVRFYGASLPRADLVTADGGVLAFGVLIAVVTGLVVGLLPALRADSPDLHVELREGTRGVSGRGRRLRHGLVVAEISLAMVLASGAGLLVNSFWRLSRVDTGLESPESVLVTQMSLSDASFQTVDEVVAFYRELLSATEAVPGVTAVGATNRMPLKGGFNVTDLFVHNDPERVSHFVEIRYVTPGIFDALGVEILEGRGLTEADGTSRGTVVVTRELARQLFGNESAVGEFIRLGGRDEPTQVVGVVSDIRDMGLHRAPPPGVYFGIGPATFMGDISLVVRGQADPMALVPLIQDAVRRVDATLPIYGTRLLTDVVAETVASRRLSMTLVALFAGLALLLGAVGIYGVMAYTVEQRTREMGVRVALGAEGAEVVRMIIRDGLKLTLGGLAVGLAGIFVLSRFLEGMLFGVEASDLLTHGLVSVLLVLVAVSACWIPARRASAVDPVEALRHS